MKHKRILDLLKKYDDESYLNECFQEILASPFPSPGEEQCRSF